MSFTLIILMGLLLIFFLMPRIQVLDKNNLLEKRLNQMKWFQNHWLAGIFIFAMNAVLFVLTGLSLYGVMSLMIPYVHILVMFSAVIASIYFWALINRAWQGKKLNRLKMGTIGSNFYLLLAVYFGYRLATLEPSFPGEDTFMRAVGLVFVISVTTVAFTTCFIMTGFSKKQT